MKSNAKRLRSCFCFVIGSAAVCALQAQTSSPVTEPLTQECGRWLTSIAFLDPADASAFCSGVRGRAVVGWAGAGGEPCPHTQSQTTEGASAIVCSSAGVSTNDMSLAAGFKAASDDPAYAVPGAGGEVTLFTRTAVWIGGLRVPAGFYSLRPLSSSEGWKLLAFNQDATREDGQQPLGSVNLDITVGGFAENRLRVEFSPDLAPDTRLRQLHFIWPTANVFVRISPATSDIDKNESNR
jgi:hypothetical protein